MAKVLTQVALDALKPTDKRREIPDAKVAGLNFILQPSGKASWAYRYRFVGKTAKLTLGPSPAIGLAMARDLARKAAADVANGVDPRAKKKAAKAEAREPALDLIENVVSGYIERYAKKKTRERSWRQTEHLLVRGIVGPWGKRRLSEIRRPEIVALLDPIADRAPTVANRTLSAFHHLCAWALERGLIEANPCAGIRAPAPEKPRDRTLDDDEIRALWVAAQALGFPYGPMIQLLALTGARVREISETRWAEFDLMKQIWSLPAQRAKNNRAHEVPLSASAIAILESLPRFERSDYVFTINGRAPVNGLSRAKRRLDQAMLAQLDGAALEPFVLHDLRRSAASGMAGLGVPPHVVEAVLNHKSGTIKGVAAVYNKYNYASEKAAALARWGDHVECLATGAEAGNVVELKARAQP
jgi:integrase